MYRLSLLGGLNLRAANGVVPGSVMSSPRQLALLTYLAAATPHGLHHRATLLALFWPEAPEDEARAELNALLQSIRRALPNSIVGRGRNEIGLAPAFWCDVQALESELDAGRFEAAVELYRGELAPGLPVAGMPEFEQWLIGERTRLREAMQEAAFVAADDAEQIGDWEHAARYAERGWHIAPEDEVALRKTMTILDRADQRPAALEAYDEFASRLALQQDSEPSSETTALMIAIRSRMSRSERRRAPALRGPAGENALRRMLGSRRGLVVAGGMAAMVIIIAGAGTQWVRTSRADGAAAQVVAIHDDSAFALAHFRSSTNLYARADTASALRAADLAYLRRSELRDIDRLHVEAWRAFLHGAGDTAIRMYRDIVAADSADTNGWLHLGEAVFHFGPQLGMPARDAAQAFARTLALDSQNVTALSYLTRLATPDTVLPEAGTSGRARASDYLQSAQIYLARGKLGAADAVLDSAAVSQPGRALEYRAMIRTLPFVHASELDLRDLRSVLRAAPDGDWSIERGSSWRLYLQGLLSVRLGEQDVAEEYAKALDASGEFAPIYPAFAKGFARLVRAEAARARGETAVALDLLGAPRLEPDSLRPNVLSYAKAHERWLRAELFREAGDSASALRWYRTFPDPANYDLHYLAPSLMRQASLVGRQDAAALRKRAAALWRNAERPLIRMPD